MRLSSLSRKHDSDSDVCPTAVPSTTLQRKDALKDLFAPLNNKNIEKKVSSASLPSTSQKEDPLQRCSDNTASLLNIAHLQSDQRDLSNLPRCGSIEHYQDEIASKLAGLTTCSKTSILSLVSLQNDSETDVHSTKLSGSATCCKTSQQHGDPEADMIRATKLAGLVTCSETSLKKDPEVEMDIRAALKHTHLPLDYQQMIEDTSIEAQTPFDEVLDEVLDEVKSQHTEDNNSSGIKSLPVSLNLNFARGKSDLKFLP